jgi:TPR repeat protein
VVEEGFGFGGSSAGPFDLMYPLSDRRSCFQQGDREAHNLLGIIYRDGLGVRPLPPAQWIKYFQAAASQDLADAKVQLAKYHLSACSSISA